MIRDQKPLSDASLRDCLPAEISPRNWYELLNGKVFFLALEGSYARDVANLRGQENGWCW